MSPAPQSVLIVKLNHSMLWNQPSLLFLLKRLQGHFYEESVLKYNSTKEWNNHPCLWSLIWKWMYEICEPYGLYYGGSIGYPLKVFLYIALPKMFLKVEGGLCLLTHTVQLIQVFVNWKYSSLEHWFQIFSQPMSFQPCCPAAGQCRLTLSPFGGADRCKINV